jgi:hypothetical protein
MASKKKSAPNSASGEQLILFRYFLEQFGKKSLNELGGRLNSTEFEGLNENQNTYFWQELDGVLQRQGDSAKLSRETLKLYDENICRYVKQIGENRGGIRLKYFQYIACLFTEMYLDRYFSDREAFAKDLNDFSEKIRSENGIEIAPFNKDNMNKLAFMCATGSGKTLIMHINISQFLYYLNKAKMINSRAAINKIIVLAPNEGMANQHLDELKLSRIKAGAFSKGFDLNFDVVVIDMNKLKEEGKVKTVSVDSFFQNNLVLVDEAHRGLAGDVWYDYRSRLSAEGGFAFEYSATLKQAMNVKKDKDLTDEYSRSIIMDYSYKFFYDDGYGKEYRIFNFKESIDNESRQLYLTGCLLSFYQQLKLFTERGKEFAPFGIEKPLLVFVGNRVTAKTSKEEMSDVEEVIRFLDDFVKNKARMTERINEILNDNTGLTDNRGNELFSQNFTAIKAFFGENPKPEDVYKDVLRMVFNSSTSSDAPRLHVLNLRQVQGEIALRIGSDGEIFGVINIGDTAGLIKNCAEKGIVAETDEFANESLFRNINDKSSDINVLIGSRKFTEGWNSWRVSTMGLINFAKGEGSQAIQLFGRGVRLRGYGGCLKRSSKLDDGNVHVPKFIEILETLTIFGVKAKYMEDFKKYLEAEEVPANEKPHEYILPVLSRYDENLHKKLRVIKVKDNANFKKQAARLILSAPDEEFSRYLNKNKVKIDCRSKIQTIESTSSTHFEAIDTEQILSEESIRFLDYERIFNELETYKNEKFYYNISLEKRRFEDILKTEGWYVLLIPETHLKLRSVKNLSLLTDFAVMALKSYMEKFFRYEKNRWEAPRLEYHWLEPTDSNFIDEYKFTYMESAGDTNGDSIEKFVETLKILMNGKNGLPNYEEKTLSGRVVAFDFRNHLYTPLITLKADNLKLTVSPTSLNDGEKTFVDKLKCYVDTNSSIFDGKNLYLLRNKSKSGMGFFEADNFYPDFVLWIDTPDVQYITFIDPKGLHHITWNNAKIEFYNTVKKLEKRLQPTSSDGKRIVLNSFIMSVTNSGDLKQIWKDNDGKDITKRHEKNVFCINETDCIDKMIQKILR